MAMVMVMVVIVIVIVIVRVNVDDDRSMARRVRPEEAAGRHGDERSEWNQGSNEHGMTTLQAQVLVNQSRAG